MAEGEQPGSNLLRREGETDWVHRDLFRRPYSLTSRNSATGYRLRIRPFSELMKLALVEWERYHFVIKQRIAYVASPPPER